MIENNFCVRQKNRTKYYQRFELLCFKLSICHNKFTLWHIRLKIHIQKNKFISLKLYSFCSLFSVNAKKTHSNRSILHVLLLCLKRNDSKTSKVATAKKLFSSMYVAGTTFFNECFLFHVITGRHLFYRYPEVLFNLHAVAWRLKRTPESPELHRSSPSEVFLAKTVLKICSKFTGEHPWRNVIPINSKNVIQITFRHGCSPVNLLHIFRTPFPKNNSGGLLLIAVYC